MSEPAMPLRIVAGWPAQLPKFSPLQATDELRVPVANVVLRDPPDLTLGPVRAGDALLKHPVLGSHLPRAPFDANVEPLIDVRLLNGQTVPAAKLRSAPAGSAGSPEISAEDRALRQRQLNDAQPRDLGMWIDRLRDAGVWAERSTSPDLLAQLHTALRRPIDTVICNLLDVDPTLPLNAATAAQFPDELCAGLTLLSRILQAGRVLVPIDIRTPPGWWTPLKPATFKLVPMVNDYPQSDPSLLLYAMLNRRLRPNRLPAELGALVLDAPAAVAVGRVALESAPMLTVPLAIRDYQRDESHFCIVPVGTLLGHVLRRLGLPPAADLLLRGGDVLRDVRIDGNAVVGGSELIVHATPLEPPINPDPCVRCGWCFESCPTRVQPANCLEAAQRDDADLARRFGINGCIDCGICSYVCPSHLPILAGIRQMRAKMDEE